MEQKDKSFRTNFLFGFVTGIALLSVVGFLMLLPKAFSGGWGGGGGEDIAEEAANTNTDTNTNTAPQKEAITPNTWKEIARELKLDTGTFNNCLDNGAKADKVAADAAKGREAGVSGTPATFINGELVSGAIPYEDYPGQDGTQKLGLKNLVEKHLKDADNSTTLEATDHIRGSKDAKVILLEYSDFQCPYCSRHQVNVQKIVSEYGDQVALVFRHFPLSFHPQAQKAAEAAECAGDQDKFWEMHDRIFATFLAQ